MLRVRPIVFTPNFKAFSELFTALGLDLVEDAPGWQVFAADSGRVAVHVADAPSIGFSFEVGSVEEFARRTVESGTDAVVIDTADGRAARITAPDGRTFLAYEASLERAAPPAEGLAVMPTWYTINVADGEKLFRAIGARKRSSAGDGSWVDLTAKNGGLVAVRRADMNGSELAFEFAGEIATLQERVAGLLTDENQVRSLRLPNPDGGEIRVTERR